MLGFRAYRFRVGAFRCRVWGGHGLGFKVSGFRVGLRAEGFGAAASAF